VSDVPSVAQWCLGGALDGVLFVAASEAALMATRSQPMLSKLKEPSGFDPSDSLADLLAKARAERLDPEVRALARRQTIVLLLTWGPLTVWVAASRGRTPGRRMVGVRLQQHDGRPATTTQALIREGTPAVRYLVLWALVKRSGPTIRSCRGWPSSVPYLSVFRS
jgi:hypothetical protein